MAGGRVRTRRSFHCSAGVVFEVLVDAAGGYDAAAYAAEASSSESGPIVRQITGDILVVGVAAAKREVGHAWSTDIWICGHTSLILVDWVESRPTSWHR